MRLLQQDHFSKKEGIELSKSNKLNGRGLYLKILLWRRNNK